MPSNVKLNVKLILDQPLYFNVSGYLNVYRVLHETGLYIVRSTCLPLLDRYMAADVGIGLISCIVFGAFPREELDISLVFIHQFH